MTIIALVRRGINANQILKNKSPYNLLSCLQLHRILLEPLPNDKKSGIYKSKLLF